MKLPILGFTIVVVTSIQTLDARRPYTIKRSDIVLRQTLPYVSTNECSPAQMLKTQVKSSRSLKSACLSKQIPRGGQVANTLPNALLGSLVMAIIEKLFKEGLAAANIKFPAGLGACIGLFFFLISLDFINPSRSAALFDALTPGAALLTKWLPVMFVPGLVCLPLSPPIGGASEVRFFLLFEQVLFCKKIHFSNCRCIMFHETFLSKNNSSSKLC
jgi:hypothetical protein